MTNRDVEAYSQWFPHIISCLLLIGVGYLLYAPALALGYFSDDYQLFEGLLAPGYSFFDTFPAGDGKYVRPLVMLTLAFEHYSVVGDAAWLHHLSNLWIHLLNSILLFIIGWRISQRWRWSFGWALLFLVHPYTAIDVYWLSGRADSLCTLFYLLGILGYVEFLRDGKQWGLVLTFSGFVGALLTKEMAVSFAFVLPWLALLFRFWGNHFPPSRQRLALRAIGVPLLITAGYLWFVFGRFYLVALLIAMGAGTILVVRLFQYEETKKERLLVIILLALLLTNSAHLIVNGAPEAHLIYLPLAITGIALSALLLAYPHWTPYFTYALLPFLAIAASQSYTVREQYTYRWNAHQADCPSFQDAMLDISPAHDLFFLTIPTRANSIRLYTNDFNSALYRCLRGRFGQFPNLQYTGALSLETSKRSNFLNIDHQPPTTFHISLDPSDGYFESPLGQIGDTLSNDTTTLTITETHPTGYPTAFTLTFHDVEQLKKTHILYFTGDEFHRLDID